LPLVLVMDGSQAGKMFHLREVGFTKPSAMRTQTMSGRIRFTRSRRSIIFAWLIESVCCVSSCLSR
jgi:hypothetical protein